MPEFKQKLNIRTNQFNLIPTNIVIAFKPGVATHANLPLTLNTKGDARIENEFGHLYVWSIDASSGLLTDWVDAGDIIDLQWAAIEDKPSSAVADIDDAVTKRHTQNSDTKLAEGTGNEVTAANAKDAVDKKHTQGTDQKLDEGGVNEVAVADVKDAVDKKHSNSLDHTQGTDQKIDDGGLNETSAAEIRDSADKKHTQDTDQYLATMVTNVLYVDNKRIDTYTANGSITKPFLTIQAAIDAVTLPSSTNKYLIEISPGAYYSAPITINKIYVTFRSCGLNGARISGKITVTNPADPTPEQITFVGLRISGGLECFASHICINTVDCSVSGADWVINPTVPTDDEYLQVFNGIWYANAILTNVYTYLVNGGYYSTFTASGCEFNINNSDINEPFEAILSGTLIGSAFGNRAGNSKFTLNAGVNLHIDADTEGGSIITLAGGVLTRSTKGANIVNVPAGTIAATDVQAAINELDTEKYSTGAEIRIMVFSQNNEPTLAIDQNMAIWIDTDDSNRVYLLFRRGVGDQTAVELT